MLVRLSRWMIATTKKPIFFIKLILTKILTISFDTLREIDSAHKYTHHVDFCSIFNSLKNFLTCLSLWNQNINLIKISCTASINWCAKILELPLVKRVRIRSYFGPHFPAFGLNTERYGVLSPNAGKCGPE